MRWPVSSSKRSRMLSRSRKQYEERRHRAHVQGVGAQPHQMAGDALQLDQHHAQPRGARRHLAGRAASPPPGSRPGCWPGATGSPCGRCRSEPPRSACTGSSSRSRYADSRCPAPRRPPSRRQGSESTRNTPCVLGCCGPMLTVIRSDSACASGRSMTAVRPSALCVTRVSGAMRPPSISSVS